MVMAALLDVEPWMRLRLINPPLSLLMSLSPPLLMPLSISLPPPPATPLVFGVPFRCLL